jgi:hypothetical protein
MELRRFKSPVDSLDRILIRDTESHQITEILSVARPFNDATPERATRKFSRWRSVSISSCAQVDPMFDWAGLNTRVCGRGGFLVVRAIGGEGSCLRRGGPSDRADAIWVGATSAQAVQPCRYFQWIRPTGPSYPPGERSPSAPNPCRHDDLPQ